jgi:hypothetical protein
LGVYFFKETSFQRGNVIMGRHIPREDIPNSQKHEQNKEATYETLKTHGTNQSFFKPSSCFNIFKAKIQSLNGILDHNMHHVCLLLPANSQIVHNYIDSTK